MTSLPPSFSYVVRISFVDRGELEGFLSWLRDRHVADVCAAGAAGAEMLLLDPAAGAGASLAIEVRYLFASRDAFARYEREEAPRLRADGLAELERLGIASGRVTFARTTGEIVARYGG